MTGNIKVVLLMILILFINSISCEEYQQSSFIKKESMGMHFHELKSFNPEWNFPLYAIRLWDCYIMWPDLEPEKGKWDFTKMDAIIDFATGKNIEVVMTLGQTPGWASNKENIYYPYARKDVLTSPPDDIRDWENYVRTLAIRYKGRIKYWEIWNEPDHLYFYSGSIKDLVSLTKTAYNILKEIDPENKIISPSVTALPGSLIWLDSYLYQGAKNYVDIIGYHYYTLSWVYPEAIRLHLGVIKSIMKKYKIEDKPIWSTESGIFFEKISYDLLISYIARMYIIQRFYGSERIFWYAFDQSNAPSSGGLIENDKMNINAGGFAYIKLTEWLIGKKIVSIKYSGLLCIAKLQPLEGNYETIVWSIGAKVNYKIPKDFTVNKIESLDGKIITLPENRKIKIGLVPVLIN